jgi:hypothetical protein
VLEIVSQPILKGESEYSPLIFYTSLQKYLYPEDQSNDCHALFKKIDLKSSYIKITHILTCWFININPIITNPQLAKSPLTKDYCVFNTAGRTVTCRLKKCSEP